MQPCWKKYFTGGGAWGFIASLNFLLLLSAVDWLCDQSALWVLLACLVFLITMNWISWTKPNDSSLNYFWSWYFITAKKMKMGLMWSPGWNGTEILVEHHTAILEHYGKESKSCSEAESQSPHPPLSLHLYLGYWQENLAWKGLLSLLGSNEMCGFLYYISVCSCRP